ncbi:hypothetical protein BKA69DRAFT_630646 [Paraphysoderma sedebokerense]|nr:hypothetical protein BKA69DRAFT_630646 [Paraphysoderma sedebokerense]
MALYFRDYTKTTSNSSMLDLFSIHDLNTADTTSSAHPLKPNFHYGLAYGACGITFIVLAQLYVNVTCAFSTESHEKCLLYYLASMGEDQRSSPRQFMWKLLFRLWTGIISFIMELYSVFAFSDNNFLHRSYLWRFFEDLMACIGLVTERNLTVLIVLLIVNAFFIVLKDAGFVDDLIWSAVNRKWLYSKSHALSSDSNIRLRKLIHEVRSQIIRSNLNYVSRISSITVIGTIALLDNAAFTHGQSIWHMSNCTNIVVALATVIIQVALSRQLNKYMFARKKLKVQEFANCCSNKSVDLQKDIESINYDDPKILKGWKTYLTLISVLAIIGVFGDLHNLPT